MKTDSMGMEWQQRGARSPHHGPHGEGSTQPGGCEDGARECPSYPIISRITSSNICFSLHAMWTDFTVIGDSRMPAVLQRIH